MLLSIVSRLGARGLSAAIQAVFLIGAARILGPSSFGDLAVGLSVGAVVGATTNLGINVHLLRVGTSREEDAQIGASLFAAVWLSSLSIVVVLAIGSVIFGMGALFAAGVVLACAEVASESVVSAVSGKERHSLASALIVGRRLVSVGVFIGLSLAGITAAYSIVLMSVPLFAIAVSSLCISTFTVFRRSILRDALAAIRDAKDAWGTTIAAQVSQLDTIVVSVVLGSGAAGVYAAAVRATLPLNLVVGSVLAIFVPKLARAHDAGAWRSASRSVRRVAALLGLSMALFAPAYGRLTSFALGAEFATSAQIVSWLVVGVAVAVGSQVLQAEFLTTVGGAYPAAVIALVSALGLLAMALVANLFGVRALGAVMLGSQVSIMLLMMLGHRRVDAHLSRGKGAPRVSR